MVDDAELHYRDNASINFLSCDEIKDILEGKMGEKGDFFREEFLCRLFAESAAFTLECDGSDFLQL